MRPPPCRTEQPPPELPAHGCRERNASRPGSSMLGEKAGLETLVPFLGARRASHIEAKASSPRFSDQATPRTPTARSSAGRPRREPGVQ